MIWRDERIILEDIYLRCHEINPEVRKEDFVGTWDYKTDEFTITNKATGLAQGFYSKQLLELCEMPQIPQYCKEINGIAHWLLNTKYIEKYGKDSKENEEMFKKLSDTEYENTVAAITDEYEDKKRDATAEYNEKLAKAEAEKVTANIREEADLWAYDLYARYNALHESGFAEELSIELLKLYISSKK